MEIGLVVREKKSCSWNVSSCGTFWGSNPEKQQAAEQASVSKWEEHSFTARPFPCTNGGRSTSFFSWHGTRGKRRGCGGYLGLQLKCDGQMCVPISLALLALWTMTLHGPECVSWCDLWGFHLKIEPLKKPQVSSATWGSSAQEFAMAQVWLLLGHCGDTHWKTVHKPNVFHVYFNICKQQQAAFYVSRYENTCKNWNRFLYFHQALQTEPLTVYRLSF